MKKLVGGICIVSAVVTIGLLTVLGWPESSNQQLHARVQLGATTPVELRFIADAQAIYLDQNENGWPDPDEFVGTSRLDAPLQISSSDKATSYSLEANLMLGEKAISEELPQKLQVKLKISKTSSPNSDSKLVFIEDGYVTMSRSATDPNILRFDGKRQMNLLAFHPEDLSPGKDFKLHAELANSQDNAESWSAVNLEEEWQESLFPDGNLPVLSMTYNAADAGIVTEKYFLDEFC